MKVVSLIWRICIGYPIKAVMFILWPPVLAIPIVGGLLGSIMANIAGALYDPFG